jgi:hypothetical protein
LVLLRPATTTPTSAMIRKPVSLENLVASLLEQAQRLGHADAGLQAAAEAAFLVAGAQGLQPPILLGQYPPQYAIDLIERQLDRIFTGRATG